MTPRASESSAATAVRTEAGRSPLPSGGGTGSRARAPWSRTLDLFCDAVLTAPLTAGHESNANQANRSGTRSYRRAQGLAVRLTRWLPLAFAQLPNWLLETRGLPFREPQVKVLGFGTGVTVFLVETCTADGGASRYALKVYRKSLGRALPDLLTAIEDRRARYRRVVEWYDGCGVVLPTQFLLLHGPLRSRAVAACVQPFIAGQMADVFGELSEAELIRRLNASPGARAQFLLFVDRTLRCDADENVCIDLVGARNLVLAGGSTDCRLLLLDVGIYDYDVKAMRAPLSLRDLQERLAYLRHVRDQVRR